MNDEQSPSDALERILAAATPLLAEHGIDGVTTREIAAAVGLNVATVHYHAGGKRELYVGALRRMHRLDAARVAGYGEEFDRRAAPTRDWLRGFVADVVDRIVDEGVAHPEFARLRVRQALEPVVDDDLVDGAADMRRPIFAQLESAFATARDLGLLANDVDTITFSYGFDWLFLGFFSGGEPTASGGRSRTDDEIRVFRAFIRDYSLRMLRLD